MWHCPVDDTKTFKLLSVQLCPRAMYIIQFPSFCFCYEKVVGSVYSRHNVLFLIRIERIAVRASKIPPISWAPSQSLLYIHRALTSAPHQSTGGKRLRCREMYHHHGHYKVYVKNCAQTLNTCINSSSFTPPQPARPEKTALYKCVLGWPPRYCSVYPNNVELRRHYAGTIMRWRHALSARIMELLHKLSGTMLWLLTLSGNNDVALAGLSWG